MAVVGTNNDLPSRILCYDAAEFFTNHKAPQRNHLSLFSFRGYSAHTWKRFEDPLTIQSKLSFLLGLRTTPRFVETPPHQHSMGPPELPTTCHRSFSVRWIWSQEPGAIYWINGGSGTSLGRGILLHRRGAVQSGPGLNTRIIGLVWLYSNVWEILRVECLRVHYILLQKHNRAGIPLR